MNEINPNSLPDLLLALRRKINKSVKDSQLKHELTATQFEMLWFIGPTGQKSMESIADYLNIKPPSVTAMVDKMEKGGLVSREKDRNDRRIIYIVLTKDTKKQLARLKKQKESVLNKITAKLSPKDKKGLERILSILVEK